MIPSNPHGGSNPAPDHGATPGRLDAGECTPSRGAASVAPPFTPETLRESAWDALGWSLVLAVLVALLMSGGGPDESTRA